MSEDRHKNLLHIPREAARFLMATSAAAVLAGTAAQADVTISKKATQNMSCQAGVCSPTAPKAVLNATDLANMLAGGDVKITTGSGATNIVVKDSVGWTSASRLTLDAIQSVEIDKPVMVTGTGAVTVTTNDGGTGGEFAILAEQGSVQFWDLGSSLIIDGQSYTLVGDIHTLAANIAANPSGFYAFAKPYDASVDGTYTGSAISGTFEGIVEGLGNAISNLSMRYSGEDTKFGFFEHVGLQGTVRQLGLEDSDVTGGASSFSGTLAAINEGLIEGCWAIGALGHAGSAVALGGLVAINGGTVFRSYAKVKVYSGPNTPVGGLVGISGGLVSQSYSKGLVSGGIGEEGFISVGGGLVGLNEEQDGRISDSFSLTTVKGGKHNCCYFGGLVGQNGSGATISNSYAAGEISQRKSSKSDLGGLIGDDEAVPGSLAHTYWDLDKGVSDPADGAGNIRNDPGIKGLTTEQLQSGLPKRFNPKIWAIDPKINGGYPYLRALPPQ